MTTCFHCGLPVEPADTSVLTASINDKPELFCCQGCLAVAQTIHAGGLDSYYCYRDTLAEKPSSTPQNFAGYDLPEVQKDFVCNDGEHFKIARLSVQGISCAACAWLIEHHLGRNSAVDSVRVNATNRSCLIRWDNSKQTLSVLMDELHAIGYRPQPDKHDTQQLVRKQESQQALMRLGVAGIGMMQVGMVSVALYAGGIQGIAVNWEVFLRWVSLVIATPVVLFSAQPFFASAWRALRARHLTMDVSVSLAIGLAYGASAWATITRSGDVYFDSVSMFTFFLLLGRHLEMRARHSSAFASENLQQLLPLTVTRLELNERCSVPLAALVAGDDVWVDAGEVVPADGVVMSDNARVDESLLTGESLPRKKQKGSHAYAGTLNGEVALRLQVTAVGDGTQLSAIERLVDHASLVKPKQLAFADRVAAWFVGATLILTVIVGAVWWQIEPGKAFWVVLSVLVVTCPCALSLATPAALTAGLNRARKMGVLITGPQAMESLATVDQIVFDKTGTLTEGKVRVIDVVLVEPTSTSGTASIDSNLLDPDRVLAVIAALEEHSRHPIAKAFKRYRDRCTVKQVDVEQGEGIEGVVENHRYRFGRPTYAVDSVLAPEPPSSNGMWQLLTVCLTQRYQPLAWVCLADDIRPSAMESVAGLFRLGRDVALLSGDRAASVTVMGERLGIQTQVAEARPHDKLAWLSTQQAEAQKVLMVGDGINDVPVLSAADVSMAMGSATRLAQSKADSILLNGNLAAIPDVIRLSIRVQRVIRQNLGWALLYNGIALPVAVMGLLPPYLAAIGMSFSSLIVVLNAMRV
ncbi:heavy metal translocating P-type ATPase [Teredinibacter purpureus]|uniref:heavy metal translocating P-type ATPase n=1 Tax=Teredinibacter purpureus TaxID=2731756 RepID=UPI0005F7D200|nr:heavy metal translocating P-type ATPase [Teredinibacter purpureus]